MKKDSSSKKDELERLTMDADQAIEEAKEALTRLLRALDRDNPPKPYTNGGAYRNGGYR